MNTFRGSYSSLRYRQIPSHLRVITWLVIATQLLLPFENQLLAALADAALENPRAAITEQQSKHLEPVETPAQVTVNRTLPPVQPPPATASFSENPSDEEIFRARIFLEPLVPMGKTSAAENQALTQALLAFLHRAISDDDSAITQFLQQFPESAWRVALLTDLGIFYRRTGYFSKSLSALEQAWERGKSTTEANARAIVDRAVAELAELNARLGRFDRLEALFAELKGREFSGPAEVKLTGARRGLRSMRDHPEQCFRCGPFALDRIRAFQNPALAFDSKIRNSRSTTNGTSLAQVAALAKDLTMNYQMAKRAPGAEVITPAVVHWKAGHFAALVKEGNGRYLVEDPTFTDNIWVSRSALDEEGSGYYLIPDGPLPKGWQPVADEEGDRVWGKGQTDNSDTDRTKCSDSKVPACRNCKGMAQYSFHTMLVSLNITDTPLGYTPPRGPAVNFKVTYNQREANPYQPSTFNYVNLGNKWTFDWMGYLVIDPSSPTNDAHYFMPGGGMEVYTGYSSGTYTTHPESHAVLVRISGTNYERRLPDGSKQVFDLSDGAATDRKTFLTKEVDTAGNSLTYTFDGSFRIAAATDAIGQVTTFSYGSTNSLDARFYLISKVTDPFGRYATFDYSQIGSQWRLIKITDVVGLKSEFTYSGDLITSLTTAYGTTTFNAGDDGTTRWLEATDSLGQTEHLEYHDAAAGIPSSEDSVPGGIDTFNLFLQYRNSFYWDKKAWQDYPGDFTKAHIYHFLHTAASINTTSGILESEKPALESRVWRNYDGQGAGASHIEGTNGSPSKIARLLDDGTTQLSQFQYNAYGKVTKTIDPTNRTTIMIYSNNLIDLLKVCQMVSPTSSNVLAQFTYNSQHLPLRVIDAAGKTNSFGYNTNGLLLAATNALGETATLKYDANSYLTNIVVGKSPLFATNSFTYDGFGRLRTSTDTAGYTLTFDYDALDRPTKITYPDGTYEQVVYRLLDPVLRKDRRGHWAATTYDQLRRVTDVQDSLNRFTHFEWCGCGGLASITDPLGRTTSWLRDLQGRTTAKIYPDTTQINYAYETNTSRLKAVTDAKNQTTLYSYFVDNNLKQVSYSNAVIATPSVSFTYDTNYNRLLTMVDGVGTNTYGYYPVTSGQLGAGRLKSVDGPFASDTVTNFYDALGRLTNRAINGVAQQITYDSLGRIVNWTNALGKFTNIYVGSTMRVSTNFYPSGQRTAFSYLPATNDFRVQTIQNLKSTGTNISRFDYTYDADGQIATWTQQADAATPTVWVTEYDPVDQLLGATVRSNSVSGAILKQFIYGYDKSGNRTSEQIQSSAGVPPAISSASHNNVNQLTNTSNSSGPLRFKGQLDEQATVTVGGNAATVNHATTNFTGTATVTLGTNVVPVVATDYSGNVRSNRYQLVVTNGTAARTLTYDLNGNTVSNITAALTTTYEWDAVDRLVAINAGTNRSEFTYNGYGRRVKTVEKTNGVATSTNWFVWCGLEPCEERNNTGATVTKRFFGGGEQISGTNYFFTRDHLGSVREMMDGSGNIKARYDYDPYGRRTKVSGTMEADFGFTGHYVHAVSGLHLAPYRGYHAEMGRWLNRDPIAESGGLNLYGYVVNNPIRWTDRFGLATFPEDFIGPMQPGDFVIMGGGNYSMMVGSSGGLTPVDGGLTDLSGDFINTYLLANAARALADLASAAWSRLATRFSSCKNTGMIQGGKGIVNQGEVVAHAPIEAVTSHEQLALQSGTLLQPPLAGTPGILVEGAEAFTYTAQGSRVLVTGSMNFNSTVSVNTVQVVTMYVKGLQ